jgi:AhpD family alkylhydroperoxidase
MLQREALGVAGPMPAIFYKKTYTLGRLRRDVAWLVRHVGELFDVYARGRLDAELREEIMAGVAYENACRWCGFVHSEWARAAGVSPEELRAATELEPGVLDDDRWAAVIYARERAAEDFQAPDERRRQGLAEHFDTAQRAGIEAIARMMTTANLMANSFDALLSRLLGKPAPQSRWIDEIVTGGLFAAGIPFGGLGLAAIRRTGLISLARRFVAFCEEFDWRVRHNHLATVKISSL